MLSFIFFDKQQLSWTYLYAKNIMGSIKNYKYSIPANISCNIFDSENVSVTSQRLPTFYEHYRRYSDDFRTLSQIYEELFSQISKELKTVVIDTN